MAPSGASGAAVGYLTRAMSIEWSRFGIKLNATASGPMATDALSKYSQSLEAMPATVPVRQDGSAGEIAWLVAHLASCADDFITGTVLTVDGGRDNHLGSWQPPGPGRPSGAASERRQAIANREDEYMIGKRCCPACERHPAGGRRRRMR